MAAKGLRGCALGSDIFQRFLQLCCNMSATELLYACTTNNFEASFECKLVLEAISNCNDFLGVDQSR